MLEIPTFSAWVDGSINYLQSNNHSEDDQCIEKKQEQTNY